MKITVINIHKYVFVCVPRNGSTESYSKGMLNYVRNSPAVFKKGCIILYSRQQHLKVVPHPHQDLILSVVLFLIFAILINAS